MLNVLRRGAAGLETATPGPGWTPPEDAIWIDLFKPSREEEVAVETALKLDIATVEEMAQIEPSSRLYQENHATFMTASLVARSEEGPATTPVTFVLAGKVLVTVRYEELRAFEVYAQQAPSQGAETGTAILLGLLDAVIERLATVLEQTSSDVEEASRTILGRPQGSAFAPLMTQLARGQSVASLVRNSLLSLSRLLSYAHLAHEISSDPACRAHLSSLQHDAQALTEHSGFVSSHVSFLLDAALGLINIEQNGIIKFFSVYAVVFLPPTLLASIWGMNFHHMPELDEPWGYPLALALMVIAAVVPLWWFKKRGWL